LTAKRFDDRRTDVPGGVAGPVIEAESADLAENQSLRWMWNELEFDGDYFGDVPDGGYRRLVEAMAAGIDLAWAWT
jgi:hypothetical protein